MHPADINSSCLAQLQKYPSPKRWLIGHSGGLDSQVLLQLMSKLVPRDKLLVVHINHQLQIEAESWAQFSAEQAKARNIAHVSINVIPANNSEQAARDARFRAFEELMLADDCLLLAQHQDDQAETQLFRFFRGAGVKGLAAMPAHRVLGQGYLQRPLLGNSRAELLTYAQQHQLAWVEDPSNQEDVYDRNYLRHKILPLIEQRWSNFSQRAAASAEQFAATEQVLNQYLDKDLEELTEALALDLSALLLLPENQMYILLRRWVEVETSLLLNHQQLKQIYLDVISATADAQPLYKLPEYSLRRFQQKLYLVADVADRVEQLADLSLGEHNLGDALLKIEQTDDLGLKTLTGVYMERRQSGERCLLVGQYSSTVKKVLQAAGIPPWLRAHWPLLKVADEVVAIPGVGVCQGWEKNKGGFSSSWCSF